MGKPGEYLKGIPLELSLQEQFLCDNFYVTK